jgi:hypothetical protein
LVGPTARPSSSAISAERAPTAKIRRRIHTVNATSMDLRSCDAEWLPAFVGGAPGVI